jgi:hypothetical protein
LKSYSFRPIALVLAGVTAASNALDAVTTVIGFSLGGSEEYSFSNFLIQAFGLPGWLLWKGAFSVAMVIVILFLNRHWNETPIALQAILVLLFGFSALLFTLPFISNVIKILQWFHLF